MTTIVSMLRAINLGGKKMIPKDTLCEIYEGLGLTKVRTYIQSGNIVFETTQADLSILTTQIEASIEQGFGYHVEVFLRRTQELHQILTNNPFLEIRHEDPGKLYVTFLYRSPLEQAWSKLVRPPNTTDEFARGDQAVYLFLPNLYGRTRLSNSYFERKLGVAATTRNWNTVNALYKMTMEI